MKKFNILCSIDGWVTTSNMNKIQSISEPLIILRNSETYFTEELPCQLDTFCVSVKASNLDKAEKMVWEKLMLLNDELAKNFRKYGVLKFSGYETEGGILDIAKGTIDIEKLSLPAVIEKSKLLQFGEMKKYRLGYDYLFLPNNSFQYKSDLIGGLGLNIMFKIYFDGEEILFENDELTDQEFIFGFNQENLISKEIKQACYLSELLICSYDQKGGLTIEPNLYLINLIRILNKDRRFSMVWEIDSYTKDIDKSILEPEFITEKEFNDILNNNKLLFDNIDNKVAQSTSYFIEEVNVI